jgi:hypothetical protein
VRLLASIWVKGRTKQGPAKQKVTVPVAFRQPRDSSPNRLPILWSRPCSVTCLAYPRSLSQQHQPKKR